MGLLAKALSSRLWGLGLMWPNPGFLLLSIPEGENKRGVKAEATPERVRGMPSCQLAKR